MYDASQNNLHNKQKSNATKINNVEKFQENLNY